MGILGLIAGQVAGKAIGAGVEYGKEKLAEHKENKLNSYIGAAFRLPKGFCEGANGKVWRVTKTSGNQLYLHIKVRGGQEYDKWFNLRDIEDYYEDV